MRQDVWALQVPLEMVDELTAEGFDITVARGTFDEVLAASTMAANLVTILVAKDKVAELIRGVRDWMTRRTAAPEGSEFVLDLSARNGDVQHKLRLVARRTKAGAPPAIDTAALESLLTSMLEDAPSRAPEHSD